MSFSDNLMYPKIAHDGPVDRYMQQMPGGSNDFFSLFLNTEFPNEPSTQLNPLKQAYPDTASLSAGFDPGLKNSPTQPKSNRSSKKRKQPVKQEEETINTVDEYEIQGLPEPERQKQTRLLKNRQAAQQFRKRQKSHIIELESKVETLSSDNTMLGSRVDMLTTENKLIKEQLDYMRNFVMNCLQLSFPPNASMQDLQRFNQMTQPSAKPDYHKNAPTNMPRYGNGLM